MLLKWQRSDTLKDISTSIPKVDGLEKASGAAKYVSDITFEGMLYAKTLRSPISHGKIKSITYPELPKGYVVIDASDIPGKNYVHMIFEDWKIFAEETVEYIGEPIALVVGEEKSVIEAIVEQTKMEFEELPAHFAEEESVVDYHYTKGDPKEAFESAAQIIEKQYDTGYQEQAYIEPQGFVGYLENENKVTVIGSIQCPYYVKNALKVALDCGDDDVRVIQAAVGGAFGGKEEFPSLMACQLAIAIKKLKKPIKLVYEREEDMLVTTKRHPSNTVMQAAIDENGHIKAIKAHIGIDGGAYIGLSGVVLSRALINISAAYAIDTLDISGDVYKTHTVPNGAFRGFGAPQAIFAMEMFMHHIAKTVKQDPYLYRMKYLAKQGDLTSTSGTFRDPILMREMIDKATAVSDYHKKAEAYTQEESFKGIGMSYFLHGCGFTGSGESDHIKAKVKLKKADNDEVYILIAAVDMGQGAKTTMMKLVAHTLDIPLSQVHFDDPDTDFVTDSGPTVASRTMMIVGGLLNQAALELKATWQTNKEQVVIKDYQQPDYIEWDQETFTGDAYPAYSWGVNIVEVSVHPVTYQVNIEGIWSVYDVGKAIDERIVLGQADGGIAQGVAYGYLEVMQHQEGQLKQKNMTDYIIPTAVDMAPSENYLIDNPYALGPYGAKGVGELSLVGGAPAVAMAIEMAIKRPITSIPMTPEKIMELMHDD